MAETVGLSGRYAVMRYYMVVVNLIFLLLGIGVIARSLWYLINPSVHSEVVQFVIDYHTAQYIFIALGLLMSIIGWLGYRGAKQESLVFLMAFFCSLLIIVVVEIGVFMLLPSGDVTLEKTVEISTRAIVQEEYGTVDAITENFDRVQKELHCCGVNGPQDWAGSKYKTSYTNMRSKPQEYHIPLSCCHAFDENECQRAVRTHVGEQVDDLIYSEGCASKLIKGLKDEITIINNFGMVIGVIECISLISSLILYWRIRNIYRYIVLSNACSVEHIRIVLPAPRAEGNLPKTEVAAKDEKAEVAVKDEKAEVAAKHKQDKLHG